jgi:hypothetical protein
MAGHVDVRVLARAPLERVWAAANDPAEWAAAGHPVHDLERDGRRLSFRVVTPPDALGRSWTYLVERLADEGRRTVYSRRLGSADFAYSHVWYGFEPAPGGTEIRCVVDFEMAAGAAASDAEMESVMGRAMSQNLAATARRAERRAAMLHHLRNHCV